MSLILVGETWRHAIFVGKTFPGKVYSCAPDSAIRFLIRKSGKRQLDIRSYVAILVFVIFKNLFFQKNLSCMNLFSNSSEHIQASQLTNYQQHQLLPMVYMMLDSYVVCLIHCEGWRRFWNDEWLHFVDKISKCLYLQFLFKR